MSSVSSSWARWLASGLIYFVNDSPDRVRKAVGRCAFIFLSGPGFKHQDVTVNVLSVELYIELTEGGVTAALVMF